MADALKSPGSAIKAEGSFLHQMLHGYAEGHRLLESSIKVPDDQTRLMLRMSDLSGSNMSRGFEEYITGYPLTSFQAYALAKTWYAPEMPRPGCVWTHTIVIPVSAMAQISSLSALLQLFKRPSEHPPSGFYANPISLEVVRQASPLQALPEERRQEMQTLLSLHYGKENNPVVLAALNSKDFEDIIFAMWSQKWPSLRMGFTFCTGSLSARSFGKRPFDVQCVPTPMTREVLREIAGAGIAEPVLMKSVPFDTPSWAVLAATDAWCCTGGQGREFLWKVSDASSGRADFVPFMAVFEALHQSPKLPALITLIAKLFPQPTAGNHLKRLLLSSLSNQTLLDDQEEQDVLFAIATMGDSQSFDAETLSVKERVAELCARKPDSASWLVGELFRSTLNPLGEEILAGLISAMDPETARRVANKQPQFLPALFRAKPGLASLPQLWLAAADRKRELFESVVAHENLDSATVTGVVNALLESGSEVFIRRALDLWGKDAVFQTLDWTEAHNGTMTETCRGALTFHLPAVMDWIEARPTRSFEAIIAIAHVVAPYSYKLSQHDSTVWVQTFHHFQRSTQEEETSYLCTLLLALAFGNAPPSPLDLVAESFERVHETVRTEGLSDNAWIIMEPLVPELPWFSNWDKCERLRRGLISAFIRHEWPASELQRRIKDRELVRQLLKSARRIEGGEEFSRRVQRSG